MLGEGEIIDCGGVGGGSYYLVHVVCWEGLVIWYRLDAFLKGWVFVVFCYVLFLFWFCLFVCFWGGGGVEVVGRRGINYGTWYRLDIHVETLQVVAEGHMELEGLDFE